VPYSPVYSAPFIQYTDSTPNLLFEVPEGFTAVARYGTVNQNFGDYACNFFFKDSEAAPALYFDTAVGIVTGQTHVWAGRVVVPGGGLLGATLSALGTNVSIYLGGYLLRNVAS
jgi:hypothetical protein